MLPFHCEKSYMQNKSQLPFAHMLICPYVDMPIFIAFLVIMKRNGKMTVPKNLHELF